MAAILAKKLGMTQRFLDDGRVERVTVLEAGPCPVTAIRTVERDGYEAVQLAFGQCKEKSITKPELGHLKKADASAHRHLAEFRDEAGELLVGQTVTVEAFAVGDNIKVSGKTKGKGFQGTIKRHNFKSGPEVARLAQRPRAGLDRRVGDAVAGVQGRARPRPDGRRARHPARADRGRDHPQPEPDARPRRRSRPAWRDRGGADRWLARPYSAAEASRSIRPPLRRRSTCRWCTRPCAPS